MRVKTEVFFENFLKYFFWTAKSRERTHYAFAPGGRFDIIDTCNLCPAELTSPTLQEVMNMEKFLETLKKHIAEHPPNFGDADSVLTMLYECYSENNPDNEQIKADFDTLYQQMNGMSLREMDQIIYPVCKLCRDHECAGFIDGIRIGVLLAQEVAP
jgi:hypothetical protein